MKITILSLAFTAITFSILAQPYTSASVFAHNDYAARQPFYAAYNNQVGYIEADIFLRNDKLWVAHTEAELVNASLLEDLYLKPIQQKITENKGYAYKGSEQVLTLMVDLKTEAATTLPALITLIENYPTLIQSKTFRVAISGNMPLPAEWNKYPAWLFFDGRPGIEYTTNQLSRVVMISTSMAGLTNWNGKGILVKEQFERVKEVVDKAHAQGKPVRFWGAPDFVSAWMKLIALVKADIINTDHVEDILKFFRERDRNTYVNTEYHSAYVPKPKVKWKKAPRNVILMIGDGTGLAQLYSGYSANRGNLSVFNIPTIGLSVTASANAYITDSAAGATSMASGIKTNNRFIGVDSTRVAVPTLVEELEQRGYNTALISCDDVTGATPASFYAHQPERGMSEPIAADFLKSGVDILIGGGSENFSSREDKRNLLNELSTSGYVVTTKFANLDTISSNRFAVLDSDAVVSMQKGRGDFLTKSLAKTLSVLTKQKQNFFIMLEAAQIDWGGHDNNLGYIITEVLDFDKTIGEAMKFVDNHNETLLIVTADHETGGLSLLDGDMKSGFVQGNFSTTDHSGIPVPVFAYGPGADNFKGVYQNTQLYHKIKMLLMRGKK